MFKEQRLARHASEHINVQKNEQLENTYENFISCL